LKTFLSLEEDDFIPRETRVLSDRLEKEKGGRNC